MKTGFEGWQFGSKRFDERGEWTRVRQRSFFWQVSKAERRAMKGAEFYGQLTRMSCLYGATLGLSFALIRIVFRHLGFTSALTDIATFLFALSLAQLVGMFRFGPFLAWLVDYRLKNGQCGSCEYGLAGVAASADGCTVCPECGAAWKLESSDA